jgi:hypothetical protein
MTLIDANPDGLHTLPGVVTHVVTVPELGLVYTSGQVAWDKDGNLVGEGDYESHAVTLDRNELGALLVAAGLGPPTEHALISLLALNGLRVSKATGTDIEHLGLDRGHRTPDDHPQGWQGGHHPAGAAHGPDDRPGHRRAHRWAGVPGHRRPAAGSARRRPGRRQDRPSRRARQDRHAPHAQTCIRHRRARCGVPLRDVQEAVSAGRRPPDTARIADDPIGTRR